MTITNHSAAPAVRGMIAGMLTEEWFMDIDCDDPADCRSQHADAIISALSAAGYQIVPRTPEVGMVTIPLDVAVRAALWGRRKEEWSDADADASNQIEQAIDRAEGIV